MKVVQCEIFLNGEIVDGFFSESLVSDESKLDLAVRGFICYQSWLVDYGGRLRAYVQKHKFYGKESMQGTAIFNYLNLTNKRRGSPSP